MAISEFPKDFWFGTVSSSTSFVAELYADTCMKPFDWAQRTGNVVLRNVHTSGGHFAALEVPDLLVGDMRAFWGNDSLSNAGVFHQRT